VTVHELSRADARRIAVRAQRLDDARPGGLLDVARRLTLLQIDPVAAIAPNADLVAWSRLGSAYGPDELATRVAGVGARLGAGQRRLPPGHPGPAGRRGTAAVARAARHLRGAVEVVRVDQQQERQPAARVHGAAR
jgi:hypothetical protein